MDKNFAQPNMEKTNKDKNVLDDDFSDSSYDVAYNTMSLLFFDQEHITQLMQVVERSKDPSKVVGTALGQIAVLAYNKLNQADLGIDNNVWAVDEGVIDSAIEEAVEFFSEANIQLNPEAVAISVVEVLKDSPIAQPPQQPASAPPGGAPNNMAVPQGAMA